MAEITRPKLSNIVKTLSFCPSNVLSASRDNAMSSQRDIYEPVTGDKPNIESRGRRQRTEYDEKESGQIMLRIAKTLLHALNVDLGWLWYRFWVCMPISDKMQTPFVALPNLTLLDPPIRPKGVARPIVQPLGRRSFYDDDSAVAKFCE